MLQALQESALERAQLQSGNGSGAGLSSPPRKEFSVGSFVNAQGPYVGALLGAHAPLNWKELLRVRGEKTEAKNKNEGSGGTKKQEMSLMAQMLAEQAEPPAARSTGIVAQSSPTTSTQDTTGNEDANTQAPSVAADQHKEENAQAVVRRPHPTGKYARDPRCHSESDSDSESEGTKCGQGPQDCYQQIYNPFYDDDERQVMVCPYFPVNGRRSQEELMEVLHFAALARDNPRGVGDDEVASNAKEQSIVVQRVIAHHLCQTLLSEIRHLEAHPSLAQGGSNQGAASSWEPWRREKSQRDVEIRHACSNLLDTPWYQPSPAELESALDACVSTVGNVVHTALGVPVLSLFLRKWNPQLDEKDSTATSFFPHDIEGLQRLGAHGELLRWRLIRAVVDGRLGKEYQSAVTQLERRIRRTLQQPSFCLLPSTATNDGLTESFWEQFPPSITGHFPNQQRFQLGVSLLIRGAAVPSSPSSDGESKTNTNGITDDQLRALMFFDCVVFELERSRRGSAL